jgi:hypothetical protein
VRDLISLAEGGTPIIMDKNTNIGHFLNEIIEHCANPTQGQAINGLRAYFGAPNPPTP